MDILVLKQQMPLSDFNILIKLMKMGRATKMLNWTGLKKIENDTSNVNSDLFLHNHNTTLQPQHYHYTTTTTTVDS